MGKENLNTPIPELTDEERRKFWSRIRVGAPNECWTWLGSHTKRYGTVWIRGHLRFVHRIAYMLSTGKHPGNVVRHKCDNPWCCNPAHLLSGTILDNRRDCVARLRARGGGRLLPHQVRDIRHRHANGEPLRSIARRFHIDPHTARDAITRKTWAYIE